MTATVQLQGSAKNQAVTPKNSNEDHPQGSEPMCVYAEYVHALQCLCISYYTFADSSECPAYGVQYQKYGTVKRMRQKAKKGTGKPRSGSNSDVLMANGDAVRGS